MATVAQHLAAKELVERLDPSLTPAESLAVRAVAHHETKYGRAWPEGHGKGSFNMGAIMTGENAKVTCSGFTHKDSNPEGEFLGCFKVYNSEEDGFRDLIRVMLKSNVRAAASNGDLRGVASAMFDNHYYTGTAADDKTNIDRYHQALRRNLTDILAATGESDTYIPVTPRNLRPILLTLTAAGLFAMVSYGALSLLSKPSRKPATSRMRGGRPLQG